MQKQVFIELRKYKKYFSIHSLLYLLLLFLFLVPNIVHYTSEEDTGDVYQSKDASLPGLNDTLSHYKQILDNIKRANDDYKELRNGTEYVDKNIILPTAFITYDKPFTPHHSINGDEQDRRFFIVLYPYTLEPAYHTVSIKDTNVLIHSAWAFNENNEPGKAIYKKGDSTEKLVDIRVSDKGVFVPIPSSQYKIIYYIKNVLLIAFFIFSLVVFLFMPITILMNISKGWAFEKQNIQYLNIIGYTCLGIPVFTILQQVVLRVIFYKSIIPQLHFRYFSFYNDYHYFILAGVIALIISKAFEKGYSLQQERDRDWF